MKLTIIICTALLGWFIQEQTFTLKEFYRGEGVLIYNYNIFPFLFAKNSFKEKYAVNINDAIEAETFIKNNYYEYKSKELKHFGSNYNIERFRDPKVFKSRYSRYNRQYAGYVDQENDTIIYIGLLNFSNSRKAKLYFEGWKNSLVLGTGDWYYSNQIFFIYNKSKKILEENY